MPMADNSAYDVIIIGAGPGGYVCAIRCAQLGLRVACVELEPALGGTCLRVGCIPSKALLESSEHYLAARKHLKAHGVIVGEVGLDLAATLKRKDKIVRQLTGGVDFLFKKNGIDRLLGRGTLLGKDGDGLHRVAVTADGADSPKTPDNKQIRAKNVIIATGSKVRELPGVQMDGDRIGGSTEALSYPEVPEHLCVIGAGVIGLELGSVWLRLGSKVTVLEYADGPFPGTDQEIRDLAAKLFKRQGFKFEFNVAVTGARTEGDKCIVEANGREPLSCDRVLVAVGRVPNTEGLGLDNVGITANKWGQVPIDSQFKTTAEGIYAIGDVVRGAMLAHKAEEEGVAVAELLATGWCHVDYDTIPNVVYTDPEIATVGKSAAQCEEAGIAVRVGSFPFSANGRAKALGSTDGFVKVVADANTDRVLGVHMIGPRVSELIVEAATAMAFGASSEDMARVCHAHPSLHEVTKEAALAVDGRALHA